MALATLAEGESYIHEAIYDGRFALADELTKMGAKIEVEGTRAIVHGTTNLRGTEVIAHDLRTGAALVLAGLVAEGETIVAPGYLVDRGHAQFATRLAALGGDVERVVVS
jgi:UDP-N-acetylglucosamine 1-carboxyvinyltransferase